MARPEKHVLVCVQGRPPGHPRGSCQATGSADLFAEFMGQMEKRQLWGRFAVTSTGCLGPCHLGASVLVYPEGIMYGQVKPEDVNEIFDKHLLEGEPIERLKVPADVWS
ncbi:MAG: (2Fe-2S) ferredoxin domain-containing protein [Magnetovibrionaceae bacterium]